VARNTMIDGEFRDFVAARSSTLQRTAYLLTGDWALAEDLVQTTLLKTYLRWHRLADIAAVEPYARRVMVNTATSWWRRRWRGERPTAVLPEQVQADATDRWLECDRMWGLVRRLPPGQRAVLVLRYYEDLTEAETARLLGVSVGTVKRQASRAMATLRGTLGTAVPGDRTTSGDATATFGSATATSGDETARGRMTDPERTRTFAGATTPEQTKAPSEPMASDEPMAKKGGPQ